MTHWSTSGEVGSSVTLIADFLQFLFLIAILGTSYISGFVVGIKSEHEEKLFHF